MNQQIETKPGNLSKKATLAGIIILLAGIMIGWAGTSFVHRIVIHQFIKNPERFTKHIKHHLNEELGLSADQAGKVNDLIDQRINKLFEIKRQLVVQLNDQIDQTEKDVAAVLNEKQNKKWHKQMDEVRHHLPPK